MPIQIRLRGQPHQSAASFKRLFGSYDPQQVAKAAGAIDDGKSVVEFTGHGGDELHVHISHPHLTATRVFHRTRDEAGNPVLGIHHIRQDTAPEIRGGGRHRFAEQLGHLRAVGVGRVTAHGAGDGEGAAAGHDSGFFVFPRYGFQGELSDEQFRSLSPELQRKMDAGGGRTFHSLFDNGGAEEWRAKGTETGLIHFDTDTNSPHHQRFHAYHAAKGREAPADATRRPAPRGVRPVAEGAASPTGVAGPNPGTGTALGLASRLRRAGLKFSRSRSRQLPAHRLVRGLRLEAVLRELAADPDATEVARQLAEAALASGSSQCLHALAEELADEGHPHAGLNWTAAGDGLRLDAEVEDELEELAEAFGSRQRALTRLRERVEGNAESPPELRRSLERLSRRR